jgi:hypothetical protein
MLVTGTRTNLIIFAAIPAVLGRLKNYRVPLARMLTLLAISSVIGVAIFSVVAATVIADPAFLGSRIQGSLAVLSGDGASDQSFVLRAAQYDAAWKLISSAPIFGVGLGYFIPITLDTPLLTVVRFGWVGTAAIILFLVVFCISVHRARNRYGPSAANTAWWAFVAVVLLNLPFGTPFEDRGFGFAMLLAAMAIAAAMGESRQSYLSPGSDKGLSILKEPMRSPQQAK